ncbi:MAG: L,D-transpeptidase [Methyloligellaceae bacterium]
MSCIFSRRNITVSIFMALLMILLSGQTSYARKIVSMKLHYKPGTIIVVNSERKLYYVLGNGRAIRYPIAIGVPQEQWIGTTFVQNKRKHPNWTPPPKSPGGKPGRTVPGGPGNPLGARAIYLDWSLYRIHGTYTPGSIGRASSNGCFRMYNKDVKDLYERVHIGAPVHVVQTLETKRKARR